MPLTNLSKLFFPSIYSLSYCSNLSLQRGLTLIPYPFSFSSLTHVILWYSSAAHIIDRISISSALFILYAFLLTTTDLSLICLSYHILSKDFLFSNFIAFIGFVHSPLATTSSYSSVLIITQTSIFLEFLHRPITCISSCHVLFPTIITAALQSSFKSFPTPKYTELNSTSYLSPRAWFVLISSIVPSPLMFLLWKIATLSGSLYVNLNDFSLFRSALFQYI